ncbi:MAG TPA: hybrid sensor histidine kinase/response regulator [Blastocatellia bacterium]|nr:hybrid sensor histidine kinase/response regulator [Blastocatellia bacterium]
MSAPSTSRTFLLLLVAAFSIVAGSTVRLTYVYADFSSQGARLVQNLNTTSVLSQDLREGISQQIDLLNRQFDRIDADFPERVQSINYALARKQIDYLKLDIGQQERLTVERIRSHQSELVAVSFQIFELLKSGDREEALLRLSGLEGRQRQIDAVFQDLYWLQMNKLQAMHEHLNGSVSAAFLAAYGVTAGLIAVLIAFMLLLRKRVLLPLSSIYKAANRIRGGDFSARAEVLRPDEIGQVARGFNFMAESLAESYADLERRVEERTRQLQQLQQQFVQAAKMSAVGQLVSGVAHELNNPLTVILGYTSLAETELASSGGDPKHIQLMQNLHFQADRCRKIVANLLQFARQVKPDFQPCLINEVIERVLQLREYEFSTRNVSIVREFDPTNPELCADSNKLQQIVLNLLNNAYDAVRETGREGTIWVRTKAFDDSVLFEFRDNGTGIADPGRVFDPFYTTKEVGKGTGLGLSVCYGLVQEHHGEIRAENWEQGARFTVILPVGKQADVKEPEASPQEKAPPRKNYHALIVDDECMIVKLQASFLTSLGIESTGVSSGEEAIEFLRNNSANLVISDIRMPGDVDGIQLYDWIAKNRTELQNRFIFVTGDSVGINTSDVFKGVSVPRIEKPFKLQEYSRVVQQILESSG